MQGYFEMGNINFMPHHSCQLNANKKYYRKYEEIVLKQEFVP